MGPGALELSFARPLGLAALALPPVLLWLARRRAQPLSVATGTFALWERIAARAPSAGPARRPRPPLATWLLALALLLGALGLAGPRLTAPAGPRTFVVLVDHSPSTALAWLAEPGPGAPGASARLARALAEAQAWLAAHALPGDRVRWISSARPALETGAGEAPDAAWLAHPDFAAPRPQAALFPGALLVTDRAPLDPPAGLGWCASGGAAVHGPVAADPQGLWVWDGARVERRPSPGAGGRAALDEAAAPLPASVRDVVQAWAGARGVELAGDPARDGDVRIAVRAAPAGGDARAEADVGRDGWRARAAFAPAGVPAPDDGPADSLWALWLAAPGGAPLVWSAPGRVEVGLSELAPADGDPALFAVSWAELLDAALLPHPAVVALAERADAGPPSRRDPPLPAPEPAPAAPLTRVALDAWLAGLAALCALASLALARAD